MCYGAGFISSCLQTAITPVTHITASCEYPTPLHHRCTAVGRTSQGARACPPLALTLLPLLQGVQPWGLAAAAGVLLLLPWGPLPWEAQGPGGQRLQALRRPHPASMWMGAALARLGGWVGE